MVIITFGKTFIVLFDMLSMPVVYFKNSFFYNVSDLNVYHCSDKVGLLEFLIVYAELSTVNTQSGSMFGIPLAAHCVCGFSANA